MLLVPTDVGVQARNLGRACVPPRHADGDTVALGGYCHMLTGAPSREIESKLHHAFGAISREDRFLNYELARRALEHHAAHGGILAFGVLAHYHEVDVARTASRERTWHAREDFCGAKIDVLVEFPAELE